MFTCSPGFRKCEFNVRHCVKVTDALRFTVCLEKSIFTPKKCIDYLGFVIISENMTISLSDVNKLNIRSWCSEILWRFSKNSDVDSLPGKIPSSFSAVQFGCLHYQVLDRGKIQALNFKEGNFEALYFASITLW